jgi:glycosyltransferase involved in cell wall biosynthesis
VTVRLWIDVEDLFEYVRTNHRRPTGIQRLAFEIYRGLQARYGGTGQICFVRHSLSGNGLQAVTWLEVAGLFAGLTTSEAAPPPPAAQGPFLPHLPGRLMIRRLAYRLPPALRAQLVEAVTTQAKSLRSWSRLIGSLGREVVRLPQTLSRRWKQPAPVDPPPPATTDGSFATLAAPGDFLLMLGATWSDYAGLVRSLCKANGLRFGMLVYDLIPLRRPEWCNHLIVRDFGKWIDRVLPLCDVVFAISRATAADVEAYARQQTIALPGPVVTLPLGSEFGQPLKTSSNRLPPRSSYALIVSTIEARKNHMLLFRVWRRMLEEMPRDAVPTLVFAGRVGWLVDDLMQQIANTNNLGGKLVIVDSPSDGELAALYDGCLFTLFPSFYEGWGLPVTESLGFGKPCLIADRTSLPEAGGKLVRSFDPDNLHDAYAVIRGVVEDHEGLARWEARIRREFQPVPWSATVDALLAGLGLPLTPAANPDAAPARPATALRGRVAAMEKAEAEEA